MNREAIMHRVLGERERQFSLPGREFDVLFTTNDWLAIIGRYVFEEVQRGAVKPSRENFEDCLVKAAAIIVAALEHCPIMEERGNFSDDFVLYNGAREE
jgi:hypothetical protein